MVATLCFALAVLSGTAVVAGVLWLTFAQSLWGHPAGPPDHLSPQEARRWVQEHAHDAGPHGMSLAEAGQALLAGRWREVWPVVLVVGGTVGVVFFLPLGILLGTDQHWVGLGGLVLGLVIMWRLGRLFRSPV